MNANLKNTCLFILALALFHSTANAQHANRTGRLLISVIDSLKREPIGDCDVLINGINNVRFVKYKVTDAKGAMELSGLPYDGYKITVYRIGYISRTVTVYDSLWNTIQLSPDSNVILQAVSVRSRINQVEMKDDRLIVHVNESLLAGAVNAIDVLKKTPFLFFGKDDALKFLGKEGVIVLINGKKTNMDAAAISAFFKNLPANSVERIEVSTSASAKIESSADAGLVNIVLKRNAVDGYFGTISGSAGTRAYNSGAVFFALKKKKFNLTLNYGLNGYKNNGDYAISRQNLPSPSLIGHYRQQGQRFNTGQIGSGLFILDYTIDSLNLVSASIDLNNSRNDKASNTHYFKDYKSNGTFENEIDTKSLTERKNMTTAVDYLRNYKNPQKQLYVSFAQSYFSNRNTYHNDPLDRIFVSNELDLSRSNESSFQTDYKQPLSSKTNLETGIKITYRNYQAFGNGIMESKPVQHYPDLNAGKLQTFNMDQWVNGYYLIFNYSFKKFFFYPGCRIEYTSNTLRDSSQQSSLNNQYWNVLPNVSAGYSLGGRRRINFKYSYKVQRPGISYLNPNLIQGYDPNNLIQGNTALNKTTTHNFELGYFNGLPNGFISATPYFRTVRGMIDEVATLINDSTLSSTFINLNRSNVLGLSLTASATLFKKMDIFFGGNLNHSWLSGYTPGHQLMLRNNGIAYTYNINLTWRLPKDFNLSAYISSFSAPVTLQGKSYGFSTSSLAVSKSLLKRQLTITGKTENFFHGNGRFTGHKTGPEFDQQEWYHFRTNVFSLSVRYDFGKRLSMNFTRNKSDDLIENKNSTYR